MLINIKLKSFFNSYNIDLEIIDVNEKEMGPERIWGGSFLININGSEEEINLEISEYPEGTFNSIVEKSKFITTSDDDIIDQFRNQLH
jgi:hypothetical protein